MYGTNNFRINISFGINKMQNGLETGISMSWDKYIRAVSLELHCH